MNQQGVALLIGGSEAVWDDMGALEALVPDAGWADYETARSCSVCKQTAHRIPMNWPGPVIVVNDIGAHFPGRIDHWASLHPDRFPKWKRERAKNGFPLNGITTWTKTSKTAHTDKTIKPWVGGSSGMLGATIARDGLKCEKAILCGVGMTQTPHFVGSTEHPYGRKWMSAKTHWRRWQTLKGKKLEVWLRSMSGNTRDLLGAPTVEWMQSKVGKAA